MSDYDKIIDLPHFEPKNHRRMDRYMRAAQFSSFAALTGYDDDIAEKGRLTDSRYELSEYELEMLNGSINEIIKAQKNRPVISVTYFKKDEKKEGGRYLTEKITVRLVDEVNRFIETDKKQRIPIDDISEIVLINE